MQNNRLMEDFDLQIRQIHPVLIAFSSSGFDLRLSAFVVRLDREVKKTWRILCCVGMMTIISKDPKENLEIQLEQGSAQNFVTKECWASVTSELLDRKLFMQVSCDHVRRCTFTIIIQLLDVIIFNNCAMHQVMHYPLPSDGGLLAQTTLRNPVALVRETVHRHLGDSFR